MQEINRKRIGKNGIQKGTKLQIDTMRVKHIDMFDIATSADKLISSGIYTVNMILRALGEIPIDEDWADQHFITKNYSTIQEILEEQQKGQDRIKYLYVFRKQRTILTNYTSMTM